MHLLIDTAEAGRSSIDDMVVAWAADRFDIDENKIKKVTFESAYVEGCPTCGGDYALEVTISMRTGGSPKVFDISYDTDLIRSILEHATR